MVVVPPIIMPTWYNVHGVVGSIVLTAMQTLFGHIMQPKLGAYDVRELLWYSLGRPVITSEIGN